MGKFKAPESSIVLAICYALKSKGYFFWVQPQAGYFDARLGRFRKHSNPFVGRGVPDINVLIPYEIKEDLTIPLWIGLEVKTDTGRPTESQKEFVQKLTDFGIEQTYFFVRSVDGALMAVESVLQSLS